MGSSYAVVLLLALIFPLLVFPKCVLSFDVTYSMMVFHSSNLLSSAGLAVGQCSSGISGKLCLLRGDAQVGRGKEIKRKKNYLFELRI